MQAAKVRRITIDSPQQLPVSAEKDGRNGCFAVSIPQLFRRICILHYSLAESLVCGNSGSDQAAQIAPPEKVQRLAMDKYAHTLFYLAQIYGMLDEREKSAHYCAETLSYQLELGAPPTLTYSHHKHWKALNAAEFHQPKHYMVSTLRPHRQLGVVNADV